MQQKIDDPTLVQAVIKGPPLRSEITWVPIGEGKGIWSLPGLRGELPRQRLVRAVCFEGPLVHESQYRVSEEMVFEKYLHHRHNQGQGLDAKARIDDRAALHNILGTLLLAVLG